MPHKLLSIIVPAYNEEKTIVPLLDKILTTDIKYVSREIIVVDDGSDDQTGEAILYFIQSNSGVTIKYIHHEKNAGKGSAIHTGIKAATGDFILIQDADLEYDTGDYNALLAPLLENKADVVYGSRFKGAGPHRILFFWHSIGNKFLTFLSNMFSNLNLTDMENGYKVFRADILKSIDLKEKRFGFEPEVTAKIAKIPDLRIYETGNAYYGRTYKEGKKINWRDGFKAIYCIFRYNLFDTKEKKQSFRMNPALAVIFLFFIAGIALIFFANGTSDEGDSVMHFLYARDAFKYPDHFFNQWAKPVYVLLSAPVAQFGFIAMKFFNLALSALALFFTYKSAKKLQIANAWMAPLLAAFAPMLMTVTLSGLTEPMFAFWLIAGIYWLITEKKTGALIWLSFLPLVRSEGLIILCVLILYLLVKKLYRYIPLLLAGQFIYSIAGLHLYKDPLWIFKTLPYATLSSAYGHGEWVHFVKSMPAIAGLILFALLLIGLLYGLFLLAGKYLFNDKNVVGDEELFLIYGGFLAVFAGHSAFWALGIFNSMGLIRVVIGILPLMALICLRGINTISDSLKSSIIKYVILAAVIIFPFLGTKYSFNWKRDFSLKADQLAELNMAGYIKKNFPDYKSYVFYYEACWNSVALDINFFDEAKHKRILDAFSKNEFPDKCFLVWDDWFARVEGHVELQQLLDDNRFELLQTFEEKDFWGVTRTVKLFRKR